MSNEEIAKLLNLIKESTIKNISWSGEDIALELQGSKHGEKPGRKMFASLINCLDIYLQPFRNDRTLITDLDQMVQLDLRIHFAEPAPGGKIKLHCSHDAQYSGTLFFKCDAFHLYSETFDRLGAGELLRMAGFSEE